MLFQHLLQDENRDVKRLAQAHIVKLEKRIESLREMTDTLQELISCCAGDERPDCPILAKLEHPDDGDANSQLQPGMTSVIGLPAVGRSRASRNARIKLFGRFGF